ncbi:MAG TPA: LacI family DNA-binding transcriptional regulator [Chloroflexota bacterium]|nr:LacI family DNA-binding transcriptional regulator [Chloroflexota bacterium]
MATAPRVKRPTSRDVARLAGVSQTTVSLVMNDVPTVAIPEETRNRVRQAIAELDYHPHEGARSLSRKATHTIGVLIPDANNPHYLDIVTGIEEYLERHGYSVFVVITNFNVDRERRSLQWLKQRRMDALILSPSSDGELEPEYAAMRERGYVLTMVLEEVRMPIDSGERLLLEHLLALGHRRIGYIYGVANMEYYGKRLQICLSLHRTRGIPLRDEWIRVCGPNVAEAYQATLDLLAACGEGERPTALVAVNDLLAMGVLSALHAAGVVVPTQMSVAGFDNTRLAPYTVPPLTTVDADARTIGAHAARLTLSRLTDKQEPLAPEEIHPLLMVRGSTGPAPLL